MSEKTRYFKIGLFTLGSLVLLGAGLLLFGAGSIFEPPPIIVETYFDGSVQGLDVGSLVKFNGVKIGKVKDILFVKDVFGNNMTAQELGRTFGMVYVKIEIQSKYFPRLSGFDKKKRQDVIDHMVKEQTFRTKLQSIGITGLVYVELGFYDPAETPEPDQFDWKPKELYIPSAPGVATRLGSSLDKMLNKLDTDIYPMIENMNKASKDLPTLVTNINAVLPHVEVISKNIADITTTGKKYPSQMIFGEAPPKSRFDR